MKEYLVFIGNSYYPKEGIKDFKKDFDDADEAEKYAKETVEYGQWYQIVTKEFQIIKFQKFDYDEFSEEKLFYDLKY